MQSTSIPACRCSPRGKQRAARRGMSRYVLQINGSKPAASRDPLGALAYRDVPPDECEEEKPAAGEHPHVRRILFRREEIRPHRVQQWLDQRDDRGLLRRHRAQPAREQPVRCAVPSEKRPSTTSTTTCFVLGAVAHATNASQPSFRTTKRPSVTAVPSRLSATSHAEEWAHRTRRKSTTIAYTTPLPAPMSRISACARWSSGGRSWGQFPATITTAPAAPDQDRLPTAAVGRFAQEQHREQVHPERGRVLEEDRVRGGAESQRREVQPAHYR